VLVRQGGQGGKVDKVTIKPKRGTVNNMNPKVSIIIPVYNAEKYVERCIEACVQQTHPNIEVIAVNDGSKDKSQGILDKLSLKYPNVMVIHQNNEGVTRARVKGVENATGDYVCFSDADDYYSKNAIESLLTIAQKEKADIVMGNCRYVTDGVQYTLFRQVYRDYYSKTECFNDFFQKKIKFSLWGKLFLKQALNLNDLDVDYSITNNEDELMFAQIVEKVDVICGCQDELYNYYTHWDSAAHSKNKSVASDHLSVIYRFKTILQNLGIYEVSQDLYEKWAINKLYHITMIDKNIANHPIYPKVYSSFSSANQLPSPLTFRIGLIKTTVRNYLLSLTLKYSILFKLVKMISKLRPI
jgi:glycosyltransferase involved in cell wall biosynthesis